MKTVLTSYVAALEPRLNSDGIVEWAPTFCWGASSSLVRRCSTALPTTSPASFSQSDDDPAT